VRWKQVPAGDPFAEDLPDERSGDRTRVAIITVLFIAVAVAAVAMLALPFLLASTS
jgi:hypothetical protein